jgi:hypothetical protein
VTWKLPKIGLISAISLFVLDQLVKWLVIGPIGLTYEGDEIRVTKTGNHKCGRCWRHRPEVPADGALDARCEAVLNG